LAAGAVPFMAVVGGFFLAATLTVFALADDAFALRLVVFGAAFFAAGFLIAVLMPVGSLLLFLIYRKHTRYSGKQ